MTEAPFSPRIVRCPTCGGDAVYAFSNRCRPFCSPRCKNSDFGAWASEAYSVDAKASEDDAPDADAIT
ncbi:MAG: DNA gyrase inhibitor YacG [Caldimonas sp.]